MKPLASSLVWITCFSISAQDQSGTQLERWACTEFVCQVTTDARPEAREFARNARAGSPWWPNGGGVVSVTLAATSMQREHDQGPYDVIRLKGSVEIGTSAFILQADEADYHWSSGEIEARGNVRVKPVAP